MGSPFVVDSHYCAIVESFRNKHNVVRMSISRNGDPQEIAGSLFPGKVGEEEETLCRFIKENVAVFRMAAYDCDFAFRKSSHDNRVVIRAARRFKGVEVYGYGIVAHFDTLGTLTFFSGGFARDLDISTIPRLSESEARDLAARYISTEFGYEFASDSSRLVITSTRQDRKVTIHGDFMLTWAVHVDPVVHPDWCGYEVSLSAYDGEILGIVPDCVE